MKHLAEAAGTAVGAANPALGMGIKLAGSKLAKGDYKEPKAPKAPKAPSTYQKTKEIKSTIAENQRRKREALNY
jgi:hypothetical protein